MFSDELGRLMQDPDHSKGEQRFILMGMSGASEFLLSVTANEVTTPSGSSRQEKLKNQSEDNMRASAVRESYDFSDSVKNPYAKRLKNQVTLQIDDEAISYFKQLAEEKGIPYQSAINLYLRDCANEHRRLEIKLG